MSSKHPYITNSGVVSNGALIVIEGVDGSGKSTQCKTLSDNLQQLGYSVEHVMFPAYQSGSSFFIKRYLSGAYGNMSSVSPYVAALFYALDRYEFSRNITALLNSGKIVICDRYSGSNMAHHGSKIANDAERRGFFMWLDATEYQLLGLPRPTISIVLRAPLGIIKKRLSSKQYSDKSYQGKDLHESNEKHIEESIKIYDDMCRLFPKDFVSIDCVRNDEMLSVSSLGNIILERVKPILPAPSSQPHKSHKSDAPPNPYVAKDSNGIYTITDLGYRWLEDAVTDVKGPVYVTKSKIESITAAAAMARLSRRPDDMRVTILDEFASANDNDSNLGQDDKLLRRIITAYGDDSVQQLIGQHLVVENASNLLTKKIEWGRLASYLEQSTRYIFFDKKNALGKYKYYTPPVLKAKLLDRYTADLDLIFDNYSTMVRKCTAYVRKNSSEDKEKQDSAWLAATKAQACDAVRPVLPVATQSTVGIYASGQAIESLIIHLLSDELDEARGTGQDLLREARKVIPSFLERADKPDRGGAHVAYRANIRSKLKEITHELLPNLNSSDHDAVNLVSFWPRNDIDLVPDMLYENSSLSLGELKNITDTWPYENKLSVFNAYIGERLNRRHKPGRALEKAHYSWDLVCDYGVFRDLQRHRMVDDLNWQLLSPLFGYDMPSLIEDAGLGDMFEECFDISYKLYDELMGSGHELEAQYVTLLGHKMRSKVTYNARQAFHMHELRTSPQGHPSYRKLVLAMHEKLSEAHPLIGSAMRFVNQDEDPELSRLAAERYTEYKIKILGT